MVGHWLLISLYYKNRKLIKCEIFNSIKQPITKIPIVIIQYIRDLKTRIDYLNEKLQHISSIFCGFYCIARFLSIIDGDPPYAFYRFFRKKYLRRNDHFVILLIKKKINKINED